MRRIATPAIAVGLWTVLTLTACGGTDDAELGDGVALDTATPGEAGAGTGQDDTARDDGPGGAADDAGSGSGGEGATPLAGECLELEEAADGVYQVGEAGTATVVVRENRLTLEDVSPATGWEHTVDTEDDDEVEVEFRRGQEELDLEVEIDDGRVKVEVCADDD